MTPLFLKKDPEYLTKLSADIVKDVSRIREILKTKGYIAAEATIVKAWEKHSDDSVCISWLPLKNINNEEIFLKIMNYLEE
jgi:hypothetical protein